MARKFIYTDKKHSVKSIMSTIIGLLTTSSLVYAVYSAYKAQGVADDRLGSTGAVILLFATLGVVLGSISKSEPDQFYLFAYIGIILNVLALLGLSMILYAGAYGL